MSFLPYLIIVAVILAMLAFSARARRRQAGVQLEQADRIAVGTDVMTTSGLYGTVVAKHDDGTVALSIAPGLEVRWELAALRDAASLPANVGDGLRRSDEADGVELSKDDPRRGVDPAT